VALVASRAELRDGPPDADADRPERSDPLAFADRSDGTRNREQIFEILSNERRRLVLRYLRAHADSETIGFRALVDQVAAWENDTSPDRLDSSDRKCVYTALRQTHLPKLDRLGVVEFDSQRGSIELSGEVDDVLRYMTFAPERERFWSRLYLLLAGLCVAATLLFWIGVGPFGSVPGIAVALGIAAAFGLASLAHLYLPNGIDASGHESDWR
jgi:DNA-binding transcriptional ArsR family regulator